MDLAEHFQAIWARRWWVLGASLLVAGAVYAWRASEPSTYRAEATLNVISAQATSGVRVTEDDVAFLARSYAELGGTRPLHAAAAERSELDLGPDAAGARLSVSPAEVGFISVAATGPTPVEAEQLAQAMAEVLGQAVEDRQRAELNAALGALREQIADLEDELADLPADSPARGAVETRFQALVQAATERELQPVDRLQLLSPARASSAPVAPQPQRDTVLALLLALVVNAELAAALQAIGGRYSSKDLNAEVAASTGCPVLATVPKRGDTVEAFRDLRTDLLFMSGRKRVASVAVVSVDAGTGKTFTSINVAIALASAGVKAMLLDADLRSPSVHERLDLQIAPGLAESLRGAPLADLVQTTRQHGHVVQVLAAGRLVTDPAAVLADLDRTLAEAQRVAEVTVVDTPPIGLFADALAVAAVCDATIVVIDAPKTKRKDVEAMVERLRRVGANPIGAVVNRAPARRKTASHYYGDQRGRHRSLPGEVGRREEDQASLGRTSG